MLSVIEELARMVSEVTPEQTRRVERRIAPVKRHEVVLGVVHNEEARAWFVVSRILKAKVDSEMHKYEFTANDEAEAQAAERAAVRFKEYEDRAEQMFWLQAREDIGTEAWDSGVTVGIRNGWQLVTTNRRRGRASTPVDLAGFLAGLAGAANLARGEDAGNEGEGEGEGEGEDEG